MPIQNFLRTSLLFIASFLILSSCGSPGDARKIPPNADDRVRKNIEEGRGFRLGNFGGPKSGEFDFASSNELWRASLDVIDFMPLSSVNYSGGIIITDWYSENQNPNESVKITIRFLTNEVRADALDIKIFYKQCSSVSQCSVSERGGQIEKELKTKILRQAAIYVKIKEENKEFKEYEGRLETPGD